MLHNNLLLLSLCLLGCVNKALADNTFRYEYQFNIPSTVTQTFNLSSTVLLSWNATIVSNDTNAIVPTSLRLDITGDQSDQSSSILELASNLDVSTTSFNWTVPAVISGSNPYYARLTAQATTGTQWAWSAQFLIEGKGTVPPQTTTTVTTSGSTTITVTVTSTPSGTSKSVLTQPSASSMQAVPVMSSVCIVLTAFVLSLFA